MTRYTKNQKNDEIQARNRLIRKICKIKIQYLRKICLNNGQRSDDMNHEYRMGSGC